ncbi:M23 family metallopeptidase [Chryseobacterium wangxinyae]|uniref:M23 family metallopeptidase n=1 Tax=Chryseobacterium sp. CY350 TaxID=2997336 RepID=UPI00226ED39D|nr:M23 family metallopeptidase [Chryseobacterium sp. CY350]MCY0978708.1 M23 family metallopeptidase [Chryseobacterium sp. CY350]WBZ93911.1 M23 family metallopeptidase [Chryseobacterium sp. CY350]
MNKKGVSAVLGNRSPVVGEKHIYHIADWYPDTPELERDPEKVIWELFRKRKNGKFTSTNIRKKGDSSFTFGEASLGNTYRLEGYIHEPEGGGLIIAPKQNKIPQISKAELLYVDDTKGSTFSFTEKLRAKAYCINMFNKEVVFTLWEDDAKGAGHNKNNMLVETQKARVNEKGVAAAEFSLLRGLVTKAMRGEHDGQLEFYVTVEYFKTKKHSTENVEIIYDPFPRPKNPPPHSPPAKEKGKSKKEEKSIGEKIAETGKELWDWWESKGTASNKQEPTKQKPDGKSTVMVKEVKVEKQTTACVCKTQDLVWGDKIGCNERKKVIEVAKNLEIDPNWLMTVMALETNETFRPSIDNGIGYVGLIQFGKGAAQDIGTTQDALIKMTFIEQMTYVEKHLKPRKSKYKTLTDLYLSVLYPSACGHGSEKDYVVLDGAAYKSNPLFFKEKGEWEYAEKTNKKGKKIKKKVPTDPNGSTYVWEVAMVAQEIFTKGLSVKENEFACGAAKESHKDKDKCPDDCSQCFDYNDVVDNPKINNQSNNVNKNRFHRAMRINNAHPKGYYHTGVDILASLNTSLRSMLCGEVTEAYNTGGDLGIIVTVKSRDKEGNYIWIRYCHLNSISVKKGQKIKHGTVIGLSGNTGNAKNVLPQFYHIHIEASKDGVFFKGNTRVDPEKFMKTKFDETKQGNVI